MFPRRAFRLAYCLLLGLPGALPAAALVSGPMLGPVDMREATVWVQADAPALIRVAYAAESGGNREWSLPVETDAAAGHTATLRLDSLQPGTRYRYQIEINGELTPGTHSLAIPDFYHGKTPPPDFTFAVGGAHYVTEEGFEPPYQILGSGYGIFESIYQARPAFMLWLGNTAHLRASDWGSRSGYLARYRQARSPRELGPLLANVPHYGTWGEADYGSPLADAAYSYRGIAAEAFRAFWPQPVRMPGLAESFATRFRYADVDVFILDTRSFRNDQPTSQEPMQVLGQAQIDWLRRELIRSQATFKIIAAGTPILNPAADSRGNLSHAKEEHGRLLQMFRDEAIPGLLFLSGGKYYGELTRLVHASSYNLYDLTVGPLTANPKNNEDELNFFRMPGSSTFERHFALIDVTGPEDARTLTLRVMSLEGEQRWSRAIPASELMPPER